MEENNELYPVFLKLHKLEVLIVGGGAVGLEKLHFLLKSSPNARVTLVSKTFDVGIVELAAIHEVRLIKTAYSKKYLQHKQLIIASTDNHKVNVEIYNDAKSSNILVNVADTPEYCDFYLGGIVVKGNIKIAISTNGKSPTLAKRLRQFFEEFLPEDINDLANNLNQYRTTLKNDFSEKVSTLNELTQSLLKEDIR